MLIFRRGLLFAVAAGLIAIPAQAVQAQTYSSKPIHLPSCRIPAGGGTDFFARLVGQKRCKELIGQPVVVENKPGAATNLGADYVAKAQPDGYTILLGDVATLPRTRVSTKNSSSTRTRILRRSR